MRISPLFWVAAISVLLVTTAATGVTPRIHAVEGLVGGHHEQGYLVSAGRLGQSPSLNTSPLRRFYLAWRIPDAFKQ
jgi:hypothetical protein